MNAGRFDDSHLSRVGSAAAVIRSWASERLMTAEPSCERHTRFAGLRAQCTCGAVWSLRGAVLVSDGDEPPVSRGTGFPLHEVRCTCGAVAHGFVPRGAITSTIRATLASLPSSPGLPRPV
jgi:hypothetical protein